MPSLPGSVLIGEPPPAPRDLPKGFEMQQKWGRNPLAIVGGIFLLIGAIQFIVFIFVLPFIVPLPLIFLIVGFFLYRAGRRQSNRAIRAMRDGRAVKGQLREVYVDETLRVNQRHPYRLVYEFDTGLEKVEGFAQTFDDTAAERLPGQPVWVLYVENEPALNTIWPPVK